MCVGQNSVLGTRMIPTLGGVGGGLACFYSPVVLLVPATTLSWSKSPWTPHCLKEKPSSGPPQSPWPLQPAFSPPFSTTACQCGLPAPHCPVLSNSLPYSPAFTYAVPPLLILTFKSSLCEVPAHVS